MKYFVKIFVITFSLLLCTYAHAEQKTVYIDMKYILNNSKAGKGAQDYLASTFKKEQKKFVDEEKKLKKLESDLLGKKSVLSKEEYKQKTDELRKNVMEYQTERRASLDKIGQQRAMAKQELLKNITPILQSYSDENKVTLIIDKKFLVMGNKDLDITSIIVEKLNKELPSLNLK